MQSLAEPLSSPARWLHDVGRLAMLALVLVPLYLLSNDYWRSLGRLAGLYGLLLFFCCRMGGYVRRVMRRLPAEIPPWQTSSLLVIAAPGVEAHFATAEVIRSVSKDPRYVQEVLKPHLQRLLAYRLSGAVDVPLDAFDAARLAQLEPTLLAFFQRPEATGLWARVWQRRRRVADVLTVLRQLEGL
jgi:hypothetical protein